MIVSYTVKDNSSVAVFIYSISDEQTRNMHRWLNNQLTVFDSIEAIEVGSAEPLPLRVDKIEVSLMQDD